MKHKRQTLQQNISGCILRVLQPKTALGLCRTICYIFHMKQYQKEIIFLPKPRSLNMLKKILVYGFALSCVFANQAIAQDQTTTQENVVSQPEKQQDITLEQALKQLPAEAIKAVEQLREQIKLASPSITDQQIDQIVLMFIKKMPSLEKNILSTRNGKILVGTIGGLTVILVCFVIYLIL